MLWQKDKLIPLGNVYSIIVNLNIWTIRTDNEIYGFNYDTNKVIWRIEIKDTNPYACKEIKKAGDYVIGTFYADDKSNNGWIFAIISTTGKIAWSKKIDTSCISGNNVNLGYFYANEKHLFLQNSHTTDSNLVLDSQTGKTLFAKSDISFTKIFESGDYILFYHKVTSELFRHSKQFTTNTKSERILKNHYALSADSYKEKLYILGRLMEQEEKQYQIYELDNNSFEILNTYDLDKKETYSGSKIVALDNGVVLIFGSETPLQLINFNNSMNNWTNPEFKSEISLTKFGLLTSNYLDDNIHSLSKDKGKLTNTGIEFKYLYFCIQDYLITNIDNPESFIKQDLAIYKWGNEVKENNIRYASIECQKQNIKDLIDFNTPEKIIKKQQLENALLKVKSSDHFENFYKDLKKIYKIRILNKKVQSFIEKHFFIESIEGPLNLCGAKKALNIGLTFDELLGEGSDDLLFPAMCIGSELTGSYFYLMLDSGKIISPHHDSLPEGSYDVYTEGMTMNAFKNGIVKHFSVYDIDQLLDFQKKATPYEIDSKYKEELLSIASDAFSKPPKQISSFIADNLSMEFLSYI